MSRSDDEQRGGVEVRAEEGGALAAPKSASGGPGWRHSCLATSWRRNGTSRVRFLRVAASIVLVIAVGGCAGSPIRVRNPGHPAPTASGEGQGYVDTAGAAVFSCTVPAVVAAQYELSAAGDKALVAGLDPSAPAGEARSIYECKVGAKPQTIPARVPGMLRSVSLSPDGAQALVNWVTERDHHHTWHILWLELTQRGWQSVASYQDQETGTSVSARPWSDDGTRWLTTSESAFVIHTRKMSLSLPRPAESRQPLYWRRVAYLTPHGDALWVLTGDGSVYRLGPTGAVLNFRIPWEQPDPSPVNLDRMTWADQTVFIVSAGDLISVDLERKRVQRTRLPDSLASLTRPGKEWGSIHALRKDLLVALVPSSRSGTLVYAVSYPSLGCRQVLEVPAAVDECVVSGRGDIAWVAWSDLRRNATTLVAIPCG